MQKMYLGRLLLIFFVFSCAAFQADESEAQNLYWSTPIVISNPEIDSRRPAVVVDPYGMVHIFWIERPTDDEGVTIANYLIHAYVASGKPSPINEVLTTEPSVDYLSATATPDGFLHITWVKNRNAIYYSRARAPDAHNAHSWSEPQAIAGPALIAMMIGDEIGRLHLVYSPEEEVALSYMQSTDGGTTWSSSFPIESTSEAPFAVNARLVVDQGGIIHLAWFNSDIAHWGLEAYYTRSTDDGKTWSDPMLVDSISRNQYEANYGPAWINVINTGVRTVHLVWDGPPLGQRWEQISSNSGVSWQEPHPLFGEMRGITGLNALVVDSAGILHLLTGRMGSQDENKLIFASRTGNDWGDIESIPGSQLSSERPSAAIAQGNRLYVAWESDLGSGLSKVMFSHTRLNTPYLPVSLIPTPDETSTPTVSKVGTTPSPFMTTPTVEWVALQPRASEQEGTSPAVGLFAGVFSPFVLVSIAVIAKLLSRNRGGR